MAKNRAKGQSNSPITVINDVNLGVKHYKYNKKQTNKNIKRQKNNNTRRQNNKITIRQNNK
jgi:hypothetical protein